MPKLDRNAAFNEAFSDEPKLDRAQAEKLAEDGGGLIDAGKELIRGTYQLADSAMGMVDRSFVGDLMRAVKGKPTSRDVDPIVADFLRLPKAEQERISSEYLNAGTPMQDAQAYFKNAAEEWAKKRSPSLQAAEEYTQQGQGLDILTRYAEEPSALAGALVRNIPQMLPMLLARKAPRQAQMDVGNVYQGGVGAQQARDQSLTDSEKSGASATDTVQAAQTAEDVGRGVSKFAGLFGARGDVAALNVITGRSLAPVLAGSKKELLKQPAKQATEEFIDESGSPLGTNLGAQQTYDPSRATMQNVVNQGIHGALVGGPMGIAQGASMAFGKRAQTPETAAANADALVSAINNAVGPIVQTRDTLKTQVDDLANQVKAFDEASANGQLNAADIARKQAILQELAAKQTELSAVETKAQDAAISASNDALKQYAQAGEVPDFNAMGERLGINPDDLSSLYDQHSTSIKQQQAATDTRNNVAKLIEANDTEGAQAFLEQNGFKQDQADVIMADAMKSITAKNKAVNDQKAAEAKKQAKLDAETKLRAERDADLAAIIKTKPNASFANDVLPILQKKYKLQSGSEALSVWNEAKKQSKAAPVDQQAAIPTPNDQTPTIDNTQAATDELTQHIEAKTRPDFIGLGKKYGVKPLTLDAQYREMLRVKKEQSMIAPSIAPVVPAEEQIIQPKPKQKADDKPIDPEKDSLLVALAKIGGLSLDEARSHRVDGSNFNHRPLFGKLLFRTDGKSFDSAAEALAQDNYPVFDDDQYNDAGLHGGNGRKSSGNALLLALTDALNGKDIGTPQYYNAKAQKAYEEAQEEARLEELFNGKGNSKADWLDDVSDAIVDELIENPSTATQEVIEVIQNDAGTETQDVTGNSQAETQPTADETSPPVSSQEATSQSESGGRESASSPQTDTGNVGDTNAPTPMSERANRHKAHIETDDGKHIYEGTTGDSSFHYLWNEDNDEVSLFRVKLLKNKDTGVVENHAISIVDPSTGKVIGHLTTGNKNLTDPTLIMSSTGLGSAVQHYAQDPATLTQSERDANVKELTNKAIARSIKSQEQKIAMGEEMGVSKAKREKEQAELDRLKGLLTPKAPTTNGQQIAAALDATATAIGAAAHQSAINRFKKEGGLTYTKPKAIAQVQKDDRYKVEINADGHAVVKAILDGDKWIYQSPEAQTERKEAQAEPAPQEEIIEHVTAKGKTIRGVVRMGITKEEAKKIDEFTFAKNGGFFIREKYLTKAEPPKEEKKQEQLQGKVIAKKGIVISNDVGSDGWRVISDVKDTDTMIKVIQNEDMLSERILTMNMDMFKERLEQDTKRRSQYADQQELKQPEQAQDKPIKKDNGPYYSDGYSSFNKGQPRTLPSYFASATGTNPKNWLKGWDAAKAEQAQNNEPAPTKQPEPRDLPNQDRLVGKNSEGKDLYEDSRGVRFFKQSGAKVYEGIAIGRNNSLGAIQREDEYRTVEEIAARQPKPQPKDSNEVIGYSDKHPSWATKHEKDVGGHIVYSNNDYALLEGFSVANGMPVYTFVSRKQDSRSVYDVESYTGKDLPSTDKDFLVSMKKQHMEESNKKHQLKPNLNFKDGQNVAHSDGVSVELADIAKQWLKMLGIESKVFITTIEDTKGQKNADKYGFHGAYAAIRSAGVDPNEGGSTRRLSNGTHYIAIKLHPRMSSNLETLAHEIGHILEKETWKSADVSTKNAIISDFNKWVVTASSKNAKQWVRELRSHTTGKLTDIPNNANAAQLSSYWRSFSEYFADQVAKWATSSEQPRSVVDVFFSKLGGALKKFFASATGKDYLPANSMKKYLDELAKTNNPLQGSYKQPIEEKPAPIKQPTKKESLLIQIDDELDSALDDLAAIFKEQGKRLSSGVDPVIMGKVLAIGIKASTLYLAKGAVKFSIWAENMIASLSGKGVAQDLVEPYLKGLYAASKMQVSPEIRKQMDKEDDVYDFDFATLNVGQQQTKGKENELSQLDDTSTKPLEGVSSNNVQGAGSQRPTGSQATRSGRGDLSGNERTGGAGLSTTRIMGDDTGEVSDTARGKGTERLAVTPAQDIATDFVITEDDNIGGGGLKTKYRNNVAAIRVLKQVESEGREATNEEQKILAKWVGWGSLYQAFRYSDGSIAKGWDKEVKELAELLTPDEMKAAVDSSVAAHYTSPKIVEAMWKAVQQLGFKGGKVLEPSVGSGNFFGAMPTKLRNSALLHGVELDNITGGIAKLLYPKAKIKAATGFQDYAIPNGYFDLAIGNPPFGNIKITDKTQRHLDGFTLHNYFFSKSIDALREGGVLAMVVTNRLMDASNTNDKARQYIDEHAELLGAIRLPNNAFLKNAGTQVTTDIIFLRKRVAGEDITTNKWMNVRQYQDKKGKTVPLNEYFHAHPEMMLGEFGAYGSMYTPDDPALVARDGQNTLALLNDAIAKLPKSVMPTVEQKSEAMAEKTAKDIPDVKVGSMFVEDGDIYIRQQDKLGERQADVITLIGKSADRVKGMINIRDAFILVRDAQLSPNKDSELPSLRKKLNVAYDAFVKTNGFINDDANKRLMRDDPSWPQLSALEEKYDKGLSATVAKTTGEVARPVSASKAAIFNVRTQFPYATITSVSSAKDGYLESLNRYGKMDIDFVANLYGQSVNDTITELGNLVYQDPVRGWVTSSDYLSGNVKLKLQAAKLSLKAQEAAKGELESLPPIEQLHRSIAALEAVIPADIESVDIDVRAGAHWLPPKHIADFAREILGINGSVNATYNKYDATWSVDFNQRNISAAKQATWSTDRKSAAEILNAALNHKQSTVYDKHDDGTTTVNVEATAAANEKVTSLKRAWADWIWQDDSRRVELSRLYNDTFNTDAPTVFDGQHLTLAGKIDDDVLRLRPHQNDGIWRITQSDSTLLDHVVGAGKTFTMIGGAMELRRMGKSNKPMFVVPNHLVGQWAADFIKLYPSANILAATKADFEAKNRKKLFARIATGDWDAVIVAHSSFGKVSLHPDEEAKFIKKEIEEMMEAEALARKEGGEKARNAKDIGKRRLAKEDKLKKLLATKNKDDDNVYWSELGVDSLFVDEAHEFKNLAFTSTIQRVAGLGNQAGSQKATDLFTKIVSLKDRVAGAKVVFATGTPISNTMAEMYTMQRYLDLERMVHQGTVLFDAWARTFGEVVSDWELSPAGKYKMNSRFAKFVNMPELMQGYLSFADVINRDDINRQLAARGETLGTPKIRTGKPQNIVVERSQDQADYIGEATTDSDGNESYPKGSLVYRAENIPKKQEKGADNMLKIMSDARKAALDMRLIDPSLPDNPNSKANEAVREILATYKKWNADKGVQLVFCDLSTPKGAVAEEKARISDLIRLADEGDEAAIKELDEMSPDELDALNSSFSVYDDMKAKLIAQGIPANQAAFIHDAKTDIQKEALFGKVRSGQIRVLIGSTAKMGAGMNVQDRLVALHHLDAPWRPSDLEQREGRIIRQGNVFYKRDPEGFEVDIMRYATKQTLDSRMWQTLEGKARFIEQIRKGDIKSRSVEDIGGEAANAAEMKAASSGNPLILEEMTLRREVQNLEAEKQRHVREQHRLKSTAKKLQEDNAYLEQQISKMEVDAKSKTPEEFEMTVGRKMFKQGEEKARERAGKALSDAAKDIYIKDESRVVGKFGDFDIVARLSYFGSTTFRVKTKSGLSYGEFSFDAEKDSMSGLTLKIANIANSIEGLLGSNKRTIENNNKEIPKVQALLSNWKDAAKLDTARKKHTEVIDQLKPKEKAKTEEAKAIVAKNAHYFSRRANINDPDDWSATPRIQVAKELERLIAQSKDGAIDTEAVESLLDRVKAKQDDKNHNEAMKPRVRGYDWIVERLTRAKRLGELPADMVDMTLWFLAKNPDIANDLGLKLSKEKENQQFDGQYITGSRIMELVKQDTNSPLGAMLQQLSSQDTRNEVGVHELLHHTERMLPQNIRDGITKEWANAIIAERKKAAKEIDAAEYARLKNLDDVSPDKETFELTLNETTWPKAAYYRLRAIDAIIEANAGSTQKLEAMFKNGTFDTKNYHLVNASEFWAVKGASIIAAKYRAKGFVRPVVQWLKGLYQQLRNIFGLSSDVPVMRGLNAVIKGDGQFVTTQMLSSNKGTLQSRVDMHFKDVTKRTPELQEAAKKLKDGELTSEQYNDLVNAYKPVEPYKTVPTPETTEDMQSALKQPQIALLNNDIQEGENVGIRLDIPAYSNHGVWVASIHRGKADGKGGVAKDPISYRSTAFITNPQMSMKGGSALAIAMGSSKGTIATIGGQWVNHTTEENYELAKKALKDPAYVQVGMDPERHAYFYDRATMQPVVSGDEAIQIGGLVLVKNPVYAPASDFLFSRDAATGSGLTTAQVRTTLVDHFGEKTVKALEDKGLLSIVDSVKYSQDLGDVQGFYDPETKKTTLIASGLNENTVIPTMLHEMGGHAGFQALLGAKLYDALMGTFNRLVASGNPIAIEAQRRAEEAETNKSTQEMEKLPYLLTVAQQELQATNLQKSAITKLINRIISAVRAFSFEKLGVRLELTPSDMVALAERMIKVLASEANQINNTKGMLQKGIARREFLIGLGAISATLAAGGTINLLDQQIKNAQKESAKDSVNSLAQNTYKAIIEQMKKSDSFMRTITKASKAQVSTTGRKAAAFGLKKMQDIASSELDKLNALTYEDISTGYKNPEDSSVMSVKKSDVLKEANEFKKILQVNEAEIISVMNDAIAFVESIAGVKFDLLVINSTAPLPSTDILTRKAFNLSNYKSDLNAMVEDGQPRTVVIHPYTIANLVSKDDATRLHAFQTLTHELSHVLQNQQGKTLSTTLGVNIDIPVSVKRMVDRIINEMYQDSPYVNSEIESFSIGYAATKALQVKENKPITISEKELLNLISASIDSFNTPQEVMDSFYRKTDFVNTARFSRASNGQPSPSPTNPKLDRLLHGIGPGEKLFNALAQPIHKWLDDHSSSQWKLVNNMSPAFKQMMREYLRDQKASEEQTKSIVENGIAMSADERNLLSDVLEKMVASGTTIPQHIVQVAAAMRSALSGQTDELVRLGMLSEGSAERWRDTYLPRLYDKAAKDPINKALAKRLNIVGDHLKGRGIFREVEEKLEAKYEKLGWENRGKGKKGHVIMWRDYTYEERVKMGEIRDALHRFATGFLSTQRDIATGRLLEKIADNPDLASVDPVAGWTLVPTATIKETGGVKRYGKLSGMYVHPDVWENTKHYIDDRDGLMEFYRQTLSVWKQGKTALNLVAHMNNVVSNAVMVTAAGANMADVARGYDSMMKEDQYYKEAKELGMLASGHFTGDIRDYFGGDIQDATTPSNFVFKAFKAAWKNKGFEFMRKMYDAEDQLFRMALYRKARELGATQAESIDFAETFMFNYADLPTGIKKIRDFGLPFISYTYKAVPAVTRVALTHPHRVLALVGMVYAFNAIAYAMLGADADEDKERKNLPDYMQGYSAWGVPKLVRLPWNDGEKAAFLDVYRWAPLGDFFAVGNRTGGADVPTWAMMSGPYWSFYNTMIQNRNGLTGRNYLEDTDTDRQVFFKRMKFGLSEWVPMYYHVDKNLNAIRNTLGDTSASKLLENMGYTGTDMRGDPAELKNSLLGATGIKVRKLDMEDQKQRKLIAIKSEVLDRKRQINRIRKDQSNPYKERDIAAQVEEIKRLREKAQEIRNQ